MPARAAPCASEVAAPLRRCRASAILAAVNQADPPPTWKERLLDVPFDVPRGAWLGRVVAWVLMALWGSSVALDRMTEPPATLHLTLILFHEAGHVLFAPFGELMQVAGGTLVQLLMPFACAVALFRRADNFGAAVCVAWTGMSLVDASVYAFDAAQPVLPLIGGGTGADGFHDFVFMFERFGELHHARGWARAMKGLGVLVLLASLAWGAVLLALQKANLASR